MPSVGFTSRGDGGEPPSVTAVLDISGRRAVCARPCGLPACNPARATPTCRDGRGSAVGYGRCAATPAGGHSTYRQKVESPTR